MQNCDVQIDGDTLVITVDLSQRHGKSASGKTVIVATTQGNQAVPDHAGVYFGLNVYAKE